MAPGELIKFLRSALDQTPDLSIRIAAVHRLNQRGAVVTHAATGTSPQGFEAEWQEVSILTVDGDTLNHCEVFDETDLDAALSRFEELQPETRRLKNAASLVDERLVAYFNARDWDTMAEMLRDDWYSDDRRPVVNVGIRRGRDVAIANMQASAELGIMFAASRPIATRGERLVLSRSRWSGPDQRAEAFHTDVLSILEIDADDRLVAHVIFDAGDIDAAFEELENRYLAGEAATQANAWSAIVESYAALNRGQLPSTTTDFIDVDHRRGAAMAPGDLIKFLRTALEQTPDLTVRIEAVHRLSRHGAVITHAASGTSPEGFEAEWREVSILIVDGDKGKRCEVYDEADRDFALARFDELTGKDLPK